MRCWCSQASCWACGGLQSRPGSPAPCAHGVDADQLVAELARLALLRQQRASARRPVARRDGLLQLAGPWPRTSARWQPPSAARRPAAASRRRRCPARPRGVVQHRQSAGNCSPKGRTDASTTPVVGQRELHPVGQCCGQRLVRLEAPVRGHQRIEIGPCAGVGRHAALKTPPDLGHGIGVVFQQVVGGGQAQRLQHAAAAQCAAARQTSCGRCGSAPGGPICEQRTGANSVAALRLFDGGIMGDSPDQAALCAALPACPAANSVSHSLQALAHLAGRLAGEGDRQNFMRPARLPAARARCATPTSRSCRHRRRLQPPRCGVGRRRWRRRLRA